MDDLVHKATTLLMQNLPLLAGIIMGGAYQLYRKKTIHDSVLRYAFLKDEFSHHHRIRRNFCAISNGKMKRLGDEGEEVGWLGLILSFYVGFGLLMLVIAYGVSIVFGDESQHIWRLAQIGTGIALYIFFWLKLHSKAHVTKLKKSKKSRKKKGNQNVDKTTWIEISGQRAEDGLPTKQLVSEEKSN